MEPFPTDQNLAEIRLACAKSKEERLKKTKKKPGNTRHRCYVFTLNNPDKNCSTEHLLPPKEEYHPFRYCVRYVVYQLEVGRDGTPHYQGYIEFYFPRSVIDIKRQFEWFQSAHFEVRKGTQDQAISYATKEDTACPSCTPFIYGIPANQGARTDLEDCKFILDGALKDAAEGLRLLSQDYYGNFLRYHKGFALYLELHRPSISRHSPPCLTMVLGPPGAGKSTFVRETCALLGMNLFFYPYEHHWWNNYNPHTHQALLLDEFCGQVPPSELNQLCDVDPVPLNVKYGKPIDASFTHVFLISNSAPRNWWSQTKIPLHSLYRRIDRLLTYYLPYGEDDQDSRDLLSTNGDTIVCPVIMTELIKFSQNC